MPKVIDSVLICTACMLMRESTGEQPDDHDAVCWSLLPDADVAPDFDTETGEGFYTFDRSSCDACGTRLAGERYEYAVFAWHR